MTESHKLQDSVFAPQAVNIRYRPDGSLILQSPIQLGEFPRHICEYLQHWASESPTRIFLAERRDQDEWQHLTYAETWNHVQSIAQSLLNRGLSKDSPIAILTANSLEHALLTFAGMLARVPVAPISPAYSAHPEGASRLAEIARVLRPGMVFVQSFKNMQRLRNLPGLESVEWVSVAPHETVTPFDELESVAPGPEVYSALSDSSEDDVAKILFTSGSTGTPKGVPQTQRMLCSAIHGSSLLAVANEPPVIVDWMPWHHTMGGNNTLNGTLRDTGTLYLDDGRPTPELFERTVRNLKEISVTYIQNVPVGIQMLVNAMEQDDHLRTSFFARVNRLLYAGAALSRDTWERLQVLSVKTIGTNLPVTSGYGTTETAPGICSTHWACEGRGEIGLPIPGVEVKLVPFGDRYEVRARGPNVMSGYLRRADLNHDAFDHEGFYKVGDAVKFVDPLDPRKGLCFAGRLSENFKLSNGSWVVVEELRSSIRELAPTIKEAVIAGHDRDDIRLLVWVSDAARDPESVITEQIANELRAYNERYDGATRRVRAFAVLTKPPSLAAGEVTDKGYVNQRAVLASYADIVDDLYSASPSTIVVIL